MLDVAPLGGDAKSDSRVEFTGEGALPSVFAVTDLAAGSIGAAALAVREYADAGAAMTPAVSVDRRLASFWFGSSSSRSAGRCRRSGM